MEIVKYSHIILKTVLFLKIRRYNATQFILVLISNLISTIKNGEVVEHFEVKVLKLEYYEMNPHSSERSSKLFETDNFTS